MKRLQVVMAWIAGLGVTVVLSPVVGMDGRVWSCVMFAYVGTACAAAALASASLPLAACLVWLVVCAALHPSPAALNSTIMILGFAGVFSIASRVSVAPIIRFIVTANLAAMVLQVAGVWEAFLRLFAPAAVVTVYNPFHPVSGLTSSTGDLGCVLAMCLPFMLRGRWRFVGAAALVALFSTQALSAIAAGVFGLFVYLWPKFRSKLDYQGARLGMAALALLSVSVALEQAEITAAVSDERWTVWGHAATMWWNSGISFFFGHGLGSWNAGNFSMVDIAHSEVRVWSQLHFDLLQLGFEAGLLGVALAVTAFIHVIRKSKDPTFTAAMAAIAVCQFGHFPFHIGTTAVVVALVVGGLFHAVGHDRA